MLEKTAWPIQALRPSEYDPESSFQSGLGSWGPARPLECIGRPKPTEIAIFGSFFYQKWQFRGNHISPSFKYFRLKI